VRDEVARRAIADLTAVLHTEIRRDRLDAVERRLTTLVKNSRTIVDANSRALWRRQRDVEDLELRRMAEEESALDIARFPLRFINTPHQFQIVFEVLRKGMAALSSEERSSAARSIVGLLDTDLSSTHRVNVVHALILLRAMLPGSLAGEVEERTTRNIRSILAGFPDNERRRLVWELEGLLERVPYKASFVDGGFTERLEEVVARKLKTLPEEALTHLPPSVWTERAELARRRTTELFDRLAGADDGRVREVIGELRALESSVGEGYAAATRVGFDGAPTPPTRVYFDQPLDCYRSVVCSMLLSEFDETVRVVDDSTLAAIETCLTRVDEATYCINHADVLWLRLVHARGGMSRPVDPENGEPLNDDSLRLLMSKPSINRRGVSAVASGMVIRGRIGENRWIQYMATLDLDRRRVDVGVGRLLK
jgi:hypothetical protein